MMQGNYLVYFPSYKYLEQGVKALEEKIALNGDKIDIEIMVQERNLSELQKEAFMQAFSHQNNEKTLVAFAVLGGMFGEGIDLVGEKLSGAIIVGVGLPLICFEQNIIKDYFEVHMGQGFDYAYTYPGMNKVMQAAGRVIRTTEDVGSVLLIDRRFHSRRYEELFPKEWFHFRSIRSNIEMIQMLEGFWESWNKY
jgi:DNA excision repair protein ERCC-2